MPNVPLKELKIVDVQMKISSSLEIQRRDSYFVVLRYKRGEQDLGIFTEDLSKNVSVGHLIFMGTIVDVQLIT